MVAWHRPLAEQLPQDTTPFATAIREAELLGVVARGCLSPIGAALRTDGAEAAETLAAACERLLPAATRAARFGADLTAVVTGTPSARLAALLDTVADKEVGGTASVWRFSPTTVRRALDTGRTADAIAADLGAVAVGALPQPLMYLINDSARTHGRVRIAPAACVIHGEEAALLAELVTHRQLAALGLRVLAPTVLVSRTPLDKTLAALRAAGYAPVAERADGTVRVEKTRRRRAAAPVPVPPLPGQRQRSVPTVTRLPTRSAPGSKHCDEPPLRSPTMDWVERTAQLRQWTRSGARAPHKPLLFLYALSRFQQDADDELRYSTVEQDLRRLLAEYGPGNRTTPAYPFHHLVSDGVWEVRTERGPGSPGTGVRELRATGAAGRLTPELRAALRRDPPLLGRMTRVLLDLNFPPSLHGELCEAVGLELEEAETGLVSAKRRQRDRRMREMVLTAYEYQCAFCGYDGRIGTVPVGLEAAHVRWWAFDGPDDLENGLCLCSLHHKLFDKGVLGLGEGRGEGHRILVSQSFVGRSTAAREHVITLAGRPVIGPQSGVRPIAAAHRSWHTSQVFQGSPRPATTA